MKRIPSANRGIVYIHVSYLSLNNTLFFVTTSIVCIVICTVNSFLYKENQGRYPYILKEYLLIRVHILKE